MSGSAARGEATVSVSGRISGAGRGALGEDRWGPGTPASALHGDGPVPRGGSAEKEDSRRGRAGQLL